MDMNPVSEQTTGDERLLLLAAALDTHAGLTFDEIAATGLLGDPSALLPDSLRRNFLLCRNQLEQIGVRTVETFYGGEVRYKIDAHLTYADPQDVDLSHDEALSLVTLLTAYLDDVGQVGSPFARDARKARDKIASVAGLSYWPEGHGDERKGGAERKRGKAAKGRGALERAASEKASERILAAYAEQHPVSFEYTDARGAAATHVLEVLGMFERHGMTYLVGRDGKTGAGPDRDRPVKVFRTDRIDARSVKVDACRTYGVPNDFCTDDYVLLPFQYGGSEAFQAVFQAPCGTRPDDFAAITMGKGTWRLEEGNDGAHWVWSVDANDPKGLVRWAVGAFAQGLLPLLPPELSDAMQEGLSRTEEAHA